jgi:hypothetical protein
VASRVQVELNKLDLEEGEGNASVLTPREANKCEEQVLLCRAQSITE